MFTVLTRARWFALTAINNVVSFCVDHGWDETLQNTTSLCLAMVFLLVLPCVLANAARCVAKPWFRRASYVFGVAT
eukprot:6559019-Lingulodinium_polyedra.AAC.1